MKLSKNDLPEIRYSLIALIAAAFTSFSFLYFSNQHDAQIELRWQDTQRQLRAAQNEMRNAKSDQQDLAAYSAKYDDYVAQHIVGKENRLDWVEGLEKLREKNDSVVFRYDIDPQKNFALQLAIASGDFSIRYSEMKIQLDLLHTGQLLDFLDALHSQIKGWYQLEGCTIQRNPIGLSETGPQLKAQCTGGWITLLNRNSAS